MTVLAGRLDRALRSEEPLHGGRRDEDAKPFVPAASPEGRRRVTLRRQLHQ